ncbi:MAG: ATP-binding cassette domain-containing protein [Thiobacillus sp.]
MSAISVSGLTKKFGKFTAVNNLSFDVSENHVVGFLGLNGAGKTTTLRMLVGLSNPSAGKIEIAGRPMKFGKLGANKIIGYLPELPSMYHWMSGHEYLEFTAKLFKIPKQNRQTKIIELLNLVGLNDAKDKRIATYSGGMKQRLGIAQSLINDPKVIILDEPVSALDPIGRKEVLEIIERLRKSRTVLFSTHVLSDVDRICDDVIIIDHGKLIASAPLSDLKSQYASQVIEVELSSNAEGIGKLINQQKWSKKVVQNGNELKIWLSDESLVGNNTVLKFLITQKVNVVRYGTVTPQTEDLFIHLIGESQ